MSADQTDLAKEDKEELSIVRKNPFLIEHGADAAAPSEHEEASCELQRGKRACGFSGTYPLMVRWAGPHLAESRFPRRNGMADLVFITVTVVFFGVAWAYALGCDRL